MRKLLFVAACLLGILSWSPSAAQAKKPAGKPKR